jgi:hypothetical protein
MRTRCLDRHFAMPPGSLTLADYPVPVVNLACARCARRGRLKRERLIEAHGADMPLPDLRHILASCEHHSRMGEACGVYFVDLAEPGTRPPG